MPKGVNLVPKGDLQGHILLIGQRSGVRSPYPYQLARGLFPAKMLLTLPPYLSSMIPTFLSRLFITPGIRGAGTSRRGRQ